MPVSKIGNVADRHILYQQFAEGDAEEVGILASWTKIDKAELIVLRDVPIAMHCTVYGRFEERKKRNVKQAYKKMSAVEKKVFKQKMEEIDEADASNGETLPPTPTPV